MRYILMLIVVTCCLSASGQEAIYSTGVENTVNYHAFSFGPEGMIARTDGIKEKRCKYIGGLQQYPDVFIIQSADNKTYAVQLRSDMVVVYGIGNDYRQALLFEAADCMYCCKDAATAYKAVRSYYLPASPRKIGEKLMPAALQIAKILISMP